VTSLQVLLNEILEIGANGVVLADTSGLVIASEVAKGHDMESLSEALGALSSIIIPQGEQVASYLSGGEFIDTVIHTSSKSHRTSVMAYSLDSDPKTCIMIISDPALESQLIHEFRKIKNKIVHALEGIAVEIPDKINLKVDRKVLSFWNTLEDRVGQAQAVDELKRALLDARDDYINIHGSYSTVLYSMNTASKRIKSTTDFSSLKDGIMTQIKEWKKKILGEEEKESEEETE
jgi:predicted regulator of Ras-like GTPase activity (Roadblock/LC7/MglB family)